MSQIDRFEPVKWEDLPEVEVRDFSSEKWIRARQSRLDQLCNYIHEHYPIINVVIFTVWAIALAVYSAYAVKGGN